MPLREPSPRDASGKSELGSRENTPPSAVAFCSGKSNQTRMRDEAAPLPALPPRPARGWASKSARTSGAPRSVLTLPTFRSCWHQSEATRLSEPRLDVSGMLWAIAMTRRKEGWRHVWTHVLAPATLHPRDCARCGARSLEGHPLSPESPSPGFGASLPPLRSGYSPRPSRAPGHPFRSRPASPGSRVAHGAPRPT